MITWPEELPHKVLREGWRISQMDQGILKSPMNAGNVRMRRQFTARITPVPISIVLTKDQLGLWRHFLFIVLGSGCAEFQMRIWSVPTRTYDVRTVQIKDAAEGVSEEPFAADRTKISFVAMVRNL